MNTITRIIEQIHADLVTADDGAVADYIPELSEVDPDQFGIVLATPDGHLHSAGDSDMAFTIQSVSKAFVYGIVLDAAGSAATDARVGLEPSGDAFNEISLEPETSRPMNAMINAGAIATTGLVPGDDVDSRFEWLLGRLSAIAGRPLGFDESVYESERLTGHRNRALAHLLRGGGILGERSDEDLDLYFRQCSIRVTCADLAAMGATLAHGGVNPVTGRRVLSEAAVERVLSVMSSSGMYDWSGSWITQVGLPAKSGVGGGIVAVLPGQLSVAVFSPRLDAQGNSVRGILAFRELSRRFNLHLFNTPTIAGEAVRRTYRLNEIGSTRRWPLAERRELDSAASTVAVVEMRGDLYFAAIERLSRAIDDASDATSIIVDGTRLGLVDARVQDLLTELAGDVHRRGCELTFVDPNRLLHRAMFHRFESVRFADAIDAALETAEEQLLRAAGFAPEEELPLQKCDLFAGFSTDDLAELRPLLPEQRLDADEVLCRTGDPGDALYVLTKGNLEVRARPDGSANRGSTRLTSVSPGACTGEIALVAGGRRSADVIATEASVCLVLDRAVLEHLETNRPELSVTLMKNILVMNLEGLRRRGTKTAVDTS